MMNIERKKIKTRTKLKTDITQLIRTCIEVHVATA